MQIELDPLRWDQFSRFSLVTAAVKVDVFVCCPSLDEAIPNSVAPKDSQYLSFASRGIFIPFSGCRIASHESCSGLFDQKLSEFLVVLDSKSTPPFASPKSMCFVKDL